MNMTKRIKDVDVAGLPDETGVFHESDQLAVYDYMHGVIRLDGGRYEVDLDRVRSGGDLIQWVTHLSEKAWFTPEVMAALLREFGTALYQRTNLTMHTLGTRRINWGRWPAQGGAATFRTFLRGRRAERTPVGDLARDAFADREWTGTTAASLRRRLADHGACTGALDALELAAADWEKMRK